MREKSPDGNPPTWMARVCAYLATPANPRLIDEHRQTVLLRTRFAAFIAAIVIPFTILVYFWIFQPSGLERGFHITAWSEAGVFLTIIATRSRFFERHFHLPFFFLVGVVCTVTEAVILQLTGGGSQSHFLFPYFLVLFGIATLFPSRFLWGVAASAMSPLSYVASELLTQGELRSGAATANLILLVDYAFIAAIANRVTTRLFFSEVEYRLALESANQRLRDLDKAKSEFFANISHDLRSPLTVVLGPLSALSSDKDNLQPRQLHYLQLALGGAAKLDSMINDLLELARIDAGMGKLRLGRVDLKEMIGGLLESSTPYAQSLGLQLVFQPPDHPVITYIDSDKFERVLMNLVSNACKFSRHKTTVTVTLTEEGDRVRTEVADQGHGIALEDQPRIFGRFARGQDENQRRTRGAGLGLAVVKEFVELHRGTVSVRSELGKGSCFTVIIPKGVGSEDVPDSAGAPVVRSRPPARLLLPTHAVVRLPTPPAKTGAPRLLIVEDTDEVRSFLETELSGQYELHSAQDGHEAMKQLLALRPDVVILDVMLPEVDGIEICRQLRGSESPGVHSLPVLMYSARGDLQTRLDAFDAGADDFLHKPFEPRELKARLDALLRRTGRQARRAS